MISLSPYLFIHIGLDIRLLRHYQNFSVNEIILEANTLLNNIEAAEFIVSNAGSQGLRTFIVKLETEQDRNRRLSMVEADELADIMMPIEKIVFAESQTKKIYVINEARFSLSSLMEHPEHMFASGVFTKLEAISRFDLRESFFCLVFSRSTAGAFHALRATESILRSYYHLKIRRGREKQPMWANMVRALTIKRGKNVSLLQKLDFIRINYRNPTAHPEAVYSVERLRDLIGLCIDVVNEMAKEFPEQKINKTP